LYLIGSTSFDMGTMACSQLGGTLVVIDSAKKNAEVKAFLLEMWMKKFLPVTGHSVFTAGQRQVANDCSSKFYWKTPKSSTPVVYTNWAAGQPDCQDTMSNGQKVKGASCLKAVIEQDLKWYDGDCKNGMVAVCESPK